MCPAVIRNVHLRREWIMWNGGAIPKLAQSIYEAKDFDRLPDLADALDEAGCTDSAILSHLRGPGSAPARLLGSSTCSWTGDSPYENRPSRSTLVSRLKWAGTRRSAIRGCRDP